MKIILLLFLFSFFSGGLLFAWADTPEEKLHATWRTLIPAMMLIVGILGVCWSIFAYIFLRNITF